MGRRIPQFAIAASALFISARSNVGAFAPSQSSPLSTATFSTPSFPSSLKARPAGLIARTTVQVWSSRLGSAVGLDSTVYLEDPVDFVEQNDKDAISLPVKKTSTLKRGLRKSVEAAFRSIFAYRQKMQLAISNSSSASSAKLREYLFVFIAGLCLSFNSGYINGCCLSGLLSTSGAEVGVSAFTGAYTKAGLALGAGNFGVFGFNLSMILSFMFGSCLSGLINPRPVERQLGPTYGPSFLIGSVLLVIAAVLSNIRPEGRSLFYFAAAANGLQNGMSSMYSANIIRSTHMSGISTDIGMIFGQILRGNRENAWKAIVLTGLASAFGLGGAASFFAVTKVRSLALVFNACFFAMIGSACIGFTAMQQHVPLWWAASGQWQWKDGEAPSSELVLELFDQADTDGNGHLCKRGLWDVLEGAGMHVSEKGIKAIFRIVDANNDGVISKEELLAVL